MNMYSPLSVILLLVGLERCVWVYVGECVSGCDGGGGEKRKEKRGV